MALSRIWSAFIIIAVLVAASKAAFMNDNRIFSNMVVGKADDAYDTVRYVMVGSPASTGIASREGFAKYLAGYGYVAADSAHAATAIITDNTAGDSISLLKATTNIPAYTYKSVQSKLVKKADGIIETCKSAVNISIGLVGIMALFMGFMSIAERAGGIRLLSKIIGPFFTRLFPDIPAGHPAMGHMMMNFSANLLGLDNAATPFGIKAMESLQEINPKKDVASNAQIMFLCLHAAGFALIPVSIIAVRASLKSANPTDIFVPCMITTFVATMAAMFIVGFKQKIKLFQPVILAWVGGLSAALVLLVMYITSLDANAVQTFSSILSNGLILLIFLLIVMGAVYKKIDVFDAFIDGAKGGFETSVRIIPYLVGMLVAISLLRTSGTFDVIINTIKSLFAALGADTRFVDALPTALIRPLSGGGARGMMVDTMKNFGSDSFAGRLASIMQGSSDTTFYVIAVYFGAVGIKNTRYAVGAMLLADLVGVLTAILMAYLFFGAV
ncbi:MAG TPA: nucleoside recognition domain-containing protein [Segetibacter sp.]|jgi:spore maturation protein SpmA/spore maturation protein SpmB